MALTFICADLLVAGISYTPTFDRQWLFPETPSLQFLLAVLLYGEPFTAAHAVSFACIWAALALLTWDLRRRLPYGAGTQRHTRT